MTAPTREPTLGAARRAGLRNSAVESLLVGGSVDLTDVAELIDQGLASVALRAASAVEGTSSGGGLDAAARSDLSAARRDALVRHAAVRTAVAPLLSGWRAAGIDVLVFKGFYLAESVYADSADRAYSDVDVALRAAPGSPAVGPAALAQLAADVAASTGWRVLWRYGEEDRAGALHQARYDGHELLQLVHARTGIQLDVHRRLVHNNVNVARAPVAAERITAAVWDAAVTIQLAGASVKAPAFVDSALVGLIASRSWSGDRHELRAHDYLDLAALMEAGAIGREQLLERARELGMARTTRAFLTRCDPSRSVLHARPPGAFERFTLDLRMVPERWPRGLATRARRVSRHWEEAVATARVWPVVGAEVSRWRRGELRLPEPGASAAGGSAPDHRTWRDVQVGTRRALQLRGIDASAHPLLAVACLATAAARRGLAVEPVVAGGHLRLLATGEPLPLTHLGAPVGGSATRWPARAKAPPPSFLARLRRVGPGGFALRLEALRQLRRVQRRLRESTFLEAHSDLVGGNASRSRAGGPPLEVGRAVESAARFVPGALCVAQSLAAQVMLASRGVPSRIHFGFRRSPQGDVSGHAWLEVSGQVVTGDEGLEDFTRTATFDA